MTRYHREGWRWHGWFARRYVAGQQITIEGQSRYMNHPSKHVNHTLVRQQLYRECVTAYHRRHWSAADSRGIIDMNREYLTKLRQLKDYYRSRA